MQITSSLFWLFVMFSLLFYWKAEHSKRKIVVLISNFLFYISYGFKYVVILLLIISISYFAAFLLERKKTKRRLVVSILSVLAPLFIFKYVSFLSSILNYCIEVDNLSLKIIAPLGISYYTFQAISYIVDVYKGKISAEKEFIEYSVYMSFFPTVTSGPIQRSGYFMKKLKQVECFSEEMFFVGFERIVLGYFKKCVIADRISAIISPVMNDVYGYNGFSLIIFMLCYTIMLYCDFSGYSDIAIGVAKIYGLDVEENFKCPYFAVSITDFWDRWHISLSTWLRDYVYIPLGGSRKGKYRTYINIMITFVVSGIWHGAGIKYLIWGGMHGTIRCLEKITGLDRHKKVEEWNLFTVHGKCIHIFRNIGMFILIAFTWVPFALPTTRGFVYFLKNMFNMHTTLISYITVGFEALCINLYSLRIIICSVVLLFVYEFFASTDGTKSSKIHNSMWFVIVLLLIVLGFNYAGESTFIYGKF